MTEQRPTTPAGVTITATSKEGNALDVTSSGRRRDFLHSLLQRRATVTVSEAWEAGRDADIYRGGEGRYIQRDLDAVGRRHDGYWRLDKESASVRRAAKRWADYWTAQ